jgi:TPR repeat protein
MANREELAVIRAARAGHAAAQLALGKLYLFGSAGLPASLPTALHWLERAARQGTADACALIGAHIPLELARRAERPLWRWYLLAYQGGIARAGLVLARLVLVDGQGGDDPARRAAALAALAEAAGAGVADAQYLLALQQGAAAPAPHGAARPALAAARADNGLPQAQFRRARRRTGRQQWGAYLQRALPLARAGAGRRRRRAPAAGGAQVVLLSRCARALAGGHGAPSDPAELQRFWELAAAGHDRTAQMALGLWCARMRADGTRTAVGAGSANFKKAIRWLTLAGEQGLAEAWYALSRIYIKPEFSQRNIDDAQKYLERAAEMGYRDAQLECGKSAWRARRENESNDVRAAYWLQQAAGAGCERAAAALRKIAPRPGAAAYTETGAQAGAAGLAASHPLLAARLELAALFSLSR